MYPAYEDKCYDHDIPRPTLAYIHTHTYIRSCAPVIVLFLHIFVPPTIVVSMGHSNLPAARGQGETGEDGDASDRVPQLPSLPSQGDEDIHAHADAQKGRGSSSG